jgi:hypothetical protein
MDQPLSCDELHEKLIILASQLGNASRTRTRERPRTQLEEGLDELQQRNYVAFNTDGNYILTEEGEEVGRLCVESLERGAQFVRKITERFLTPNAVAKVTILVDFLLAVMKLMAGTLTGSVALMADGADAAVDTVSAVIVWGGIRFGKELLGTVVIVLMMFLTSASIGYESATSILGVLSCGLEPISQPLMVISVEAFVLLAAVFLYTYQSYVGKRYGNLSLISQSVDSKNHIYVAGAVIAGAIFSMFGIPLVDSLIGAFIALRMASDGVELVGEVLSRREGEETDYSKYRTFVEAGFEKHRDASFRTWILYTIRDLEAPRREEIILALKRVYAPDYVPIMTEFDLSVGRDFDFDAAFGHLVKPMLDDGLISEEGGEYRLTRKGVSMVESTFRTLRYTSL